MLRSLLLTLATFPLLAQNVPAPEVWTIDPVHSGVNFTIRHFVSNVPGQFREFDGRITIDRANPERSTVEFTIQAASINTGSEDRDKHLRSEDFFDVAEYPTISFKSTSITPKGKANFDVTGDLTMRGVTRRITIPVTYLGSMKGPRGEKSGFELNMVLNRKDYGIVWNRVLDSGGSVLGDEVKVSINLEADRK
jgi:polyisoprenoid-binding protein YceI